MAYRTTRKYTNDPTHTACEAGLVRKHGMCMAYKTTRKHTNDPTHTACEAAISTKIMAVGWPKHHAHKTQWTPTDMAGMIPIGFVGFCPVTRRVRGYTGENQREIRVSRL